MNVIKKAWVGKMVSIVVSAQKNLIVKNVNPQIPYVLIVLKIINQQDNNVLKSMEKLNLT